jgi:hypothetical protein
VKNNNNILDNYLQEKVDDASFEFQEAHWQHALNALQQDDDDKKPILWWRTILLAIAILATGLGAYLFTNKNAPIAVTHNTPNVAPQTINRTPIIANTTPNNNIQPSKINEANTDNIAPNTTILKSTANNNIKVSQPEAAQPVALNTSTLNTKTGTNNKKKYYSNAATNLDNNNTDTTSKTTTETISKINNATASLPIITPQPSKAKQVINNIKNKISNIVLGTPANNNVTNDIEKNNTIAVAPVSTKSKKVKISKSKSEKTSAIIITKNLANSPIESPSNAMQVTASQQAVNTTKPLLSPDEQQKLNKRYVKGLNNYEQKQKSNTKTDTIMISTASAGKPTYAPIMANTNNATATITVTAGNSKTSKPSLMVNVSASIAKAPLNIYNNTTAYTINPWLSCGYYFPISSKLSVQTMLGFTYLSGLSFEYSAYKTRYNFGADTSTYKLINKTMYQLYTPITIGYQIAPKHQIFAGGGIIIGFNMLNAEKNYNSNVYNKTWGYTDAYKQLDAFATLAYQYQLLKNMYAQFSYIQGFADITKNSVQANTITDRNSRFQIGLNIKLK